MVIETSLRLIPFSFIVYEYYLKAIHLRILVASLVTRSQVPSSRGGCGHCGRGQRCRHHAHPRDEAGRSSRQKLVVAEVSAAAVAGLDNLARVLFVRRLLAAALHDVVLAAVVHPLFHVGCGGNSISWLNISPRLNIRRLGPFMTTRPNVSYSQSLEILRSKCLSCISV